MPVEGGSASDDGGAGEGARTGEPLNSTTLSSTSLNSVTLNSTALNSSEFSSGVLTGDALLLDDDLSLTEQRVVTARGTEHGLVLRIDGKADWNMIRQELDHFLGGRKKFFEGGEVSIEWIDRLPSPEQAKDLGEYLLAEYGLRVVTRRRRFTVEQRTQEQRNQETRTQEQPSQERSGAKPPFGNAAHANASSGPGASSGGGPSGMDPGFETDESDLFEPSYPGFGPGSGVVAGSGLPTFSTGSSGGSSGGLPQGAKSGVTINLFQEGRGAYGADNRAGDSRYFDYRSAGSDRRGGRTSDRSDSSMRPDPSTTGFVGGDSGYLGLGNLSGGNEGLGRREGRGMFEEDPTFGLSMNSVGNSVGNSAGNLGSGGVGNPRRVASQVAKLLGGPDLMYEDDANAKILFGTLRSGQRVETPFSLVIIGDVNPGADLVAGGDIIVLGSLRGTAQASAYDDDALDRVIIAMQMQPMQLRIGSVLSRGSEEVVRGAEIARIENRRIVVEAFNPRMLWGKKLR